ncbi:MAG: energy-coupling factor transporter ATPase [Ruminococcaceae bacterium]|nr:energy-coupling factor transporter ATPase [Oscillospiraceae bacterium]
MKLKVENLSYIYSPDTPHEKHALKDISFSVESGEFIGLIGHSGSGKSTLVQQLNGLEKPTSGTITVGDRVITGKNADTKGLCFEVGLVFQYPEQQLFAETIYQDIAFGPSNMGLSQKEIDMRVRTAMELVGLPLSMAEKSPFAVSGGQKRRVAIAGVLAMEPGILILDEPTAGLDPKGRDEILDSIRKIHKHMGMTVILVSHSMEDVAKYCDRLFVLNEGELMLSGTLAEVFSHAGELKKVGLSVPQVTDMVQKLREKGINIAENIFTVQDAIKEILKLRGKSC